MYWLSLTDTYGGSHPSRSDMGPWTRNPKWRHGYWIQRKKFIRRTSKINKKTTKQNKKSETLGGSGLVKTKFRTGGGPFTLFVFHDLDSYQTKGRIHIGGSETDRTDSVRLLQKTHYRVRSSPKKVVFWGRVEEVPYQKESSGLRHLNF